MEIKENLEKKDKKKQFLLSPKIRWVIMIIFTLLYVTLMLNVGIFNFAANTIKKDFKIKDEEFGLLGTFNGGGRIIGTLLFMLIVNKFNRKYIIILSLLLNALSIYLFTKTTNLNLLYIERGINGVFQVFGFIYFPIWIDQFGIQKKKTIMMTIIQFAAPLGMVLGYVLNLSIGSKRWRLGFLIEVISTCFFTTLTFFFPRTYFAKNVFFKLHINIPVEVKKKKKIKKSHINGSTIGNDDDLFNINDNDGSENLLKKDSLSKDSEESERSASIFYIAEKEKSKEKTSFCKNIWIILTNKLFISSVLYKSTTQFICQGIGYWLTAFLENQLSVKENKWKTVSYINVIVGGPCIGLFLGGFLGSLTGGYEKKRSVILIFFLQFFASIIGILVIFSNHVLSFNFIIAGFFILNSAVIPINTGLILWSLPKELKSLGNGISNLIVTFLGKFPAPFLYGFVQDKFDNIDNKIGMIFLMSIAFLGDIFLFFSVIFRYKFKDPDNPFKKQSFVDTVRKSINGKIVNSAFNNIITNEENEDSKNYLEDNNTGNTKGEELKNDD